MANKIDKLINELCPDGVEFKALGEVATIQRGASPRPIQKFLTSDINGVPWIKIGDTLPNSKYVTKTKQKITEEGSKKSRLLKKGDFIISNSMSFGRPYILNIDGAIHDGWAAISNFQGKIVSDFLYYYLSSKIVQNYWDNKINSGSVSNLNTNIIKTLQIPIPPLPIQEEIVKILDTFTNLKTELKTELETELEARKKQYEYYREKLLSFGDDVEFKELESVCLQISAGGDLPNKYKKGQTKPSEEFPYPIYSNGTDENALYGYSSDFKVDKEAVTISARGTIGFHTIRKPKFTPIVRLIILIPDNKQITTKFLNYALDKTEIGHSGGSIPQLTTPNVKKIKIPVPNISEQNRIVEILDKFDALINDISIGLPAEIADRQKQYEYYREKLLTFKEV